jgi:hypothetical protein
MCLPPRELLKAGFLLVQYVGYAQGEAGHTIAHISLGGVEVVCRFPDINRIHIGHCRSKIDAVCNFGKDVQLFSKGDIQTSCSKVAKYGFIHVIHDRFIGLRFNNFTGIIIRTASLVLCREDERKIET